MPFFHYSTNNIDSCGTNVMTRMLMIIMIMNGMTARTSGSNRVLPTRAPTNSETPTGGVMSPTARFAVMMIPKWIGSMPICVTTGSKIGVKMMIAAIASMNVPTTSKSKLTSSKMTIGDKFESDNIDAIDCGTCSRVKTIPKIDAEPIMNKMTDVVTTDDTSISRNVSQLICR